MVKRILCFGDSNTYGLRPDNGKRYDETTRWTSLLQEELGKDKVQIIEEGLCGRTTIFEDLTRKGRNASAMLPILLESHAPLDEIIVMLGTNDLKAIYQADQSQIGRGIEELIQEIYRFDSSMKIFLLSPIHLGEQVYFKQFDPEFNQLSVKVSKELENEYREIAKKYSCDFLAASSVAKPSIIDQEHLDESGHKALASKIAQHIQNRYFIRKETKESTYDITTTKICSYCGKTQINESGSSPNVCVTA